MLICQKLDNKSSHPQCNDAIFKWFMNAKTVTIGILFIRNASNWLMIKVVIWKSSQLNARVPATKRVLKGFSFQRCLVHCSKFMCHMHASLVVFLDCSLCCISFSFKRHMAEVSGIILFSDFQSFLLLHWLEVFIWLLSHHVQLRHPHCKFVCWWLQLIVAQHLEQTKLAWCWQKLEGRPSHVFQRGSHGMQNALSWSATHNFLGHFLWMSPIACWQTSSSG